MTEKQLDLVTYVAAVLIIVGCFAPMTDLTVLGKQSLYDVAEIPAYIIMASAAASVGLIFLGMRALTLFAAIGGWIGLLIPRFNSWRTDQKQNFFDKAEGIASDPMGYMAGDIFTHLNALEWGGYCLFAGLILLTVRSIAKKS
ncbi:hypothetical protein GCM10017044_14200 [Kordiimonas sediminis]|uniref:Lipoprotein n=1 Tax=Kordiimonas sediminis TaxID=1735581 RepID=A0A919AQZ1_9PROT|nr:hypothetical protein [Kordiimonas sediminis]GHF20491.1 hypothetical protein GCM10017044_14200 [Kordiimonas sediminis]